MQRWLLSVLQAHSVQKPLSHHFCRALMLSIPSVHQHAVQTLLTFPITYLCVCTLMQVRYTADTLHVCIYLYMWVCQLLSVVLYFNSMGEVVVVVVVPTSILGLVQPSRGRKIKPRQSSYFSPKSQLAFLSVIMWTSYLLSFHFYSSLLLSVFSFILPFLFYTLLFLLILFHPLIHLFSPLQLPADNSTVASLDYCTSCRCVCGYTVCV